jgi:hypothetical protein
MITAIIPPTIVNTLTMLRMVLSRLVDGPVLQSPLAALLTPHCMALLVVSSTDEVEPEEPELEDEPPVLVEVGLFEPPGGKSGTLAETVAGIIKPGVSNTAKISIFWSILWIFFIL